MSKAQLSSPSASHYEDKDDIDESDMDLRFLKGGYKRLNVARKETDTRLTGIDGKLTDLDGKMDSILRFMEKADSQDTDISARPRIAPPSSQTQRQVYSDNLEQNRENQQLGYRSGKLNIVNRESMLQKVEMPGFLGKHPYVWIQDVERFFTIGRYDDEERLEMVALSWEGRAKKWFCWEWKRNGFRDWEGFKNKLILRFAESSIEVFCESETVQATQSPVVEETNEKSVEESAETFLDWVDISSREDFHEKEGVRCESETIFTLKVIDSIEEHELQDMKSSPLAICYVLQQQIAQLKVVSVEEAVEINQKSTIVNDKPNAYKMLDNFSHRTKQIQKQKQRKCFKNRRFKFKNRRLSSNSIVDDMYGHSGDNVSLVMQPYDYTNLISTELYCAHQQFTHTTRRVTSKHKQRKCYKAWKSKFKYRKMHRIMSQMNLHQPVTKEDNTYNCSHPSTQIVSMWNKGKFNHLRMMRQPNMSSLLYTIRMRRNHGYLKHIFCGDTKIQRGQKGRCKQFSAVLGINNPSLPRICMKLNNAKSASENKDAVEVFQFLQSTKPATFTFGFDQVISTASHEKGAHTEIGSIQRPSYCIKTWTIQTDSHLWHRWKIKAMKLQTEKQMDLQHTPFHMICGQDPSVLLQFEAFATVGIELEPTLKAQLYFSVWHC